MIRHIKICLIDKTYETTEIKNPPKCHDILEDFILTVKGGIIL